jgi:ATP-dependent protease ClpP protease subunit
MMSKKSKKFTKGRGVVALQTQQPGATGSKVITQTQTTASEKEQLIPLIQALEQARGNRVIVYWLTDLARISEAVVPSLYDQLTAIGHQKVLDLFLFTRGGDTEAPWRIVTLMREFCDRFAVLVPYRAHSAGTMLSMGADEIVMTPMSVLSPIDPSRTHPLLPRREGAAQAEPISVQDMRHAMTFIRETAKPSEEATYTPDAMAQIVTALFDKIHPLAIGAIEQSYALSKLIATRCLSTHMISPDNNESIEKMVNKLCDDYKSHAYPICRKEARDIGLKVVDASPSVDQAMMDLARFYMARDIGFPKATVRPSPGQSFKLYIAWLDSVNKQMRVEQDTRVEKDDQARPVGDRWVEY